MCCNPTKSVSSYTSGKRWFLLLVLCLKCSMTGILESNTNAGNLIEIIKTTHKMLSNVSHYLLFLLCPFSPH